jgi:hypothetical protein
VLVEGENKRSGGGGGGGEGGHHFTPLDSCRRLSTSD